MIKVLVKIIVPCLVKNRAAFQLLCFNLLWAKAVTAGQVLCLAAGLVFELMIALPDNPAVFVVAVPDLRAVPPATATAADVFPPILLCLSQAVEPANFTDFNARGGNGLPGQGS